MMHAPNALNKDIPFKKIFLNEEESREVDEILKLIEDGYEGYTGIEVITDKHGDKVVREKFYGKAKELLHSMGEPREDYYWP